MSFTPNYAAIKEKRMRELENDMEANDLIFIDTCSIMENSFPAFVANIAPALSKCGKKLIVIRSVIDELEKKLNEGRNSTRYEYMETEIHAYTGLYGLSKLISYEMVMYDKTKDDMADQSFDVLFVSLRRENRILLLTQDVNLTQNILRLNDNAAVRGERVSVKRIDSYGFLSIREAQPPHQVSPRQKTFTPRNNATQQNAVAEDGTQIATKQTLTQLLETPTRATAHTTTAVSTAAHQPIAPATQPTPSSKPAVVQTARQKPATQPKPTAVRNPKMSFTELDAKKFAGTVLHIPEGYVNIAEISRNDITEIYLPQSAERIMPHAFSCCSDLCKVVVPKTVSVIDSSAFANCQNVTVHCAKDSLAHMFAQQHNIKFQLV